MGTRRGSDLTGPAADAAVPTAGSFGPWNPGIDSRLPRALLPLSTMFRPENVATRIDEAEELHDLTGLDVLDLVAFRPERLVLHEVLVRVTADLSVDTGARVEDLGINFRRMTNAILTRHLAPRMSEITAAYDALRRDLSTVIAAELAARLFAAEVSAPTSPTRKRGIFGWFRRGAPGADLKRAEISESGSAADAIQAWEADAQANPDALRRAAAAALARAVSAIAGRHGGLWGTPGLIASVATTLAVNDYGSAEIGRLVAPYFLEAARREEFVLLPAQEQPVIMNTKGASAAGKSTMRPEQKQLAQRIGATWSEFALISPDIWRKQLLDYASLGAAYKYGGACTGDELKIIDQKLDRYMAQKAQRHATTHLLIDRFRFDSFAPDSTEAGSNLLTRFGHTIYLFFMITPPADIVTRAWQRGLEVGRYKAVDDLLAHNIEAYAGMPELFFTWALRSDKDVHYEFLDNTVRYGERPRTAAFGWNGEMNVLDVKAMLDVQRFRRVDLRATGPGDLYEDLTALAPEQNAQFLVDCARRLPCLNFVDQASGRVYLRIERAQASWADPEALQIAMTNPDTRAGILAVAPDTARLVHATPCMPRYLTDQLGPHRIHTLGHWGTPAAADRNMGLASA